MINFDCDVLVAGGGHAGCEAAAAAARVGAKTLLLTGDLNGLGRMSCNPAMGGIAKGHLVREIDALGGVMPEVTDKTAIQFRVLNRSKGFAVWSPRTQCDRLLYTIEMRKVMESISGLTIEIGSLTGIEIGKEGYPVGITDDGRKIFPKTIILACGTFLNGLLHFGEKKVKGGRFAEEPVGGLTESLNRLGFHSGRLKTGTPPRLDGKTIDYNLVQRQDSDKEPIFFSYRTTRPCLPQKPCWITHTNEDVHQTIKDGLDRAPLYSGQINGVGPRYCPSIEDKIVRFADKPRHTIFLEPEGLDTDLIYPNGFSTSLPEDLQISAIRKISGLQNVDVVQLGYAIEYDFFPPHQLKRTLETKLIAGLYFAGQINGTSGYEEAGAQGLVAGCNAAHQALGREHKLTLERDEAYTGVLIDDIITRGTDEPYRMFTSRAEFRLMLRLDNAEERLTEKAWQAGLISEEKRRYVQNRMFETSEIIAAMRNHRIKIENGDNVLISDLLKRPEYRIDDILNDLPEGIVQLINRHPRRFELLKHVEAEIKYSGYLKRQNFRAEELKRNRRRTIPQNIDYETIRGLSIEGREKLIKIRPEDLGSAANIPGITPADLTILLIHLKRFQG